MKPLFGILNALIHAPLKMVKLVRLLTMMQRSQVERINQLESYFFHPDYACHIGGESRISGTYDGWPAYRDKIILGEVSTPGKILNIVPAKNSITLMTRLTGEREGKSLDLDVDFYFRFSDRRIIEQRSIPSDNQKWSEFWE